MSTRRAQNDDARYPQESRAATMWRCRRACGKTKCVTRSKCACRRQCHACTRAGTNDAYADARANERQCVRWQRKMSVHDAQRADERYARKTTMSTHAPAKRKRARKQTMRDLLQMSARLFARSATIFYDDAPASMRRVMYARGCASPQCNARGRAFQKMFAGVA